ncbi:hypothetical protein PanWU01x14_255820 [Parasponia andersonii]|uniref:Uncharacterized protein n=1 Tax=Parasponia andersonii TaxID=3476 RepID=A0A2P5BAJ0_PARAD|nr:hypothetical protein PanWU01x14_255820 [Parasponia andersonii]
MRERERERERERVQQPAQQREKERVQQPAQQREKERVQQPTQQLYSRSFGDLLFTEVGVMFSSRALQTVHLSDQTKAEMYVCFVLVFNYKINYQYVIDKMGGSNRLARGTLL